MTRYRVGLKVVMKHKSENINLKAKTEKNSGLGKSVSRSDWSNIKEYLYNRKEMQKFVSAFQGKKARNKKGI